MLAVMKDEKQRGADLRGKSLSGLGAGGLCLITLYVFSCNSCEKKMVLEPEIQNHMDFCVHITIPVKLLLMF